MAPVYAKYATLGAEDLARDAQAMGIGQRLFLNNCAQCHGSDARGSKGFPNLADNDWLGPNTMEAIKKTIVEGRTGMMPPMAAAVGNSDDVKNVANYVLSLSGNAHNDIAAQLGKMKFGSCAACHGADGKGNTALGAPSAVLPLPSGPWQAAQTPNLPLPSCAAMSLWALPDRLST